MDYYYEDPRMCFIIHFGRNVFLSRDDGKATWIQVTRVSAPGSLMVKQRIYIPCATDNWPMWVRLPPGGPNNKGSNMVCRLMFVASTKVIESVLTLQFDKFLNPQPTQTVIYLGSVVEPGRRWRNPVDLLKIYQEHGIDTSTFTVVHDLDILEQYDQLNLYGNFNFWIRQQLIKFLAIENCQSENILVQDSDIILTKPYQYLANNEPVPYVLKNVQHDAEYYEFVEKFTGRSRQTPDSFITDIFPLKKSYWQSLKKQIEAKYNLSWIDAFKHELKQKTGHIWFSEYEILGNWMLTQNPNLQTVVQTPFYIESRQSNMIKDRNWNHLEYHPDITNAVSIRLYDNMPHLDYADLDYCRQLFMQD